MAWQLPFNDKNWKIYRVCLKSKFGNTKKISLNMIKGTPPKMLEIKRT